MNPLVTIRFAMEIEGVRYGLVREVIRPTDLKEVGHTARMFEDLILPTLQNHFGFALSPVTGGNE